MAAEKATALVVRLVDFSETSVVATLFTREFGKVHALAKGARRPRGPFESALDLLCECRIVFLRKSSGALDLLTEAKLERRFRPASRELSSLYAGYYVAELLAELTDDHDPAPELYDAARAVLELLEGDVAHVTDIVLAFELTALRVAGHLPSFEACAECGTSISTEKRVAFSGVAGGVLCESCRQRKTRIVNVSGKTIEALSAAASYSPGAAPPALDPRLRGEARGLVNHYLSHLLGHKPRMHTFLGMLSD